MIRRQGGFAALSQFRPPRSERAQVQPDTCGTGSAIERKRDWPLCWIVAGVSARISDVENFRFFLRLVFVLFFVGFFLWRGRRVSFGLPRSLAFAFFRFFLFAPIPHHHVTGRGAIMDRFASDVECVLRHAWWRIFFLLFFAFVLIAVLRIPARGRSIFRGSLCFLARFNFQFARHRFLPLRVRGRR